MFLASLDRAWAVRRGTRWVGVALLAAVAALTAGTGRAQNKAAVSAPMVKQTTQQLVFTIDGKTTTVTADHIVLRKKGTTLHSLNRHFPQFSDEGPLYTLKGSFHVTDPHGWEFWGKDAELNLWENSVGKLVALYPRGTMQRRRPVRASDGTMTFEETTLGNPGETVSVSFYLNPQTHHANVPPPVK